MTNDVKSRVLTPYVMICRLQKSFFLQKIKKLSILEGIYHDKWCQNSAFDTICHDMQNPQKKNARWGAQRRSRAGLREAQRGSERPDRRAQRPQRGSDWLRLAQRAARRQRAAHRGLQRLREAQRDSEWLRGALTGPEWSHEAQTGSERLWAALRGPEMSRWVQSGPARLRAEEKLRENKNLEFCEVHIMTNGVKPRVLTSFVMIYRLQKIVFYKKSKNCKFSKVYIMTNGVKTRVLTSFVMIYNLQN